MKIAELPPPRRAVYGDDAALDVDAADHRSLSAQQLVGLVRDRITLPQRRALSALDPSGRLTAIDRRIQRSLQDLRRMRLAQHVIAELVLPASGNGHWHLTALGRVVRERLERDAS